MQLLPGEKLCAIYIALAHQLRMALHVITPNLLEANLTHGQACAVMNPAACGLHDRTWIVSWK